jgi:hypothetical protein
MILKAQQGMPITRIASIKGQLTNPEDLLDQSQLIPMEPKEVPKQKFSFNPSSMINIASTAGLAATDLFAEGSVDKFGMTNPEGDGSVAKSVFSGVGTGAQIGSMLGPIGTAVGAGVGGIIGAITGSKQQKKEITAYERARQKKEGALTRTNDANQFQAMQQQSLSAKNGMKFSKAIEKRIADKSSLIPVFKSGGKVKDNVIVKGKLHKENNNLGERDKGIPVITNDGTKAMEFEKEEWVTSASVTKQIEELADIYNKSKSDSDLVALGKFVKKQLLSNTTDNSEKFGMK